MILHWSFDPVLVEFGPLTLRWYGLLFVSAFLAAQWGLGRLFAREGLPAAQAAGLLTAALVGAVVGARLVHCLVYEPAYYLANPMAIPRIWEGGLASHGGVLGLVVALAIAARRQRLPLSFVGLLDRVAVPAAFAAAMIRVANFLNSEIVGVPTAGGWGVVFTAVDAAPRHPVQLYEAAAYLATGLLLLVLYRRGAVRRAGLLLGTLLAAVFSARIALETVKTAQAAYDSGLAASVGQWLSLPFVLLGLVLVVRSLAVPCRAAPAG